MAERSMDLVMRQVLRERDQQARHFEGLDTKAGIVLGFSGILIALGLDTTTALGALGLAAAVLAAIFAVGAFFPRKYPVLEVRKLRERYVAAEARFTEIRIVDTTIRMIEEASTLIEEKALRLKIALILLSLAGLLLAVGDLGSMVTR